MRESTRELKTCLEFQLSLLRLAAGCEQGEYDNAETAVQSQILEGLVEAIPTPAARSQR